MRSLMLTALAASAVLALAGVAVAGEAECYNSDEGTYPCWFDPGDGGDFNISADGYTTYYVDVTEPGVAWVVAMFPGSNDSVNLPGPYYREKEQPACWRNPDTSDEICAY